MEVPAHVLIISPIKKGEKMSYPDRSILSDIIMDL
jgi:hypothetical protein